MNYCKFSATIAIVGAMAAPVLAASNSDLQGVQSAKMSLSDAISAAQKASNGKAIYGKYHTENGTGDYEVVVVANGHDETYKVDPNTGEAVKAKQDNASKTDEKGESVIQSAQTSLSEAIRTAQKEGGKAMEAKLDTEKGTTAYEVEVANGDHTSKVWVDVNSGKIVRKS